MRLIDADALKNHYSWWEGGTKENTLDEQKEIFDTIVNLQPTIDPVKRGKWIPVDEKNDAFDCSECDAMVQRRYNYCPHCGARMERSEILLMRFVRDYLESEVKNGTVQKD